MELAEALAQLQAWCDQSRGEPIEIAPGVALAFQSRSVFSEASVRQIEMQLGFALPFAYFEFMATVGESTLFGWSPSGGGPFFYHPEQVIDVTQTWNEAEPGMGRFCFVGEHRSMGDMMGFCLDHPAPNFDIFCHEYPPDDYVTVSDELNSWRDFGSYIVGMVASFGKDTL